MHIHWSTAARIALAVAAFCALAWTHAHGEAATITCRASWYGAESGRVTASGERFRPYGLSAAHRSIAFGTLIGVRLANRKITLRVNDRGPAT